jgi:AraC family transcriptional regulator
MKPQIITKPAFTVVGLLIHTKGKSPEIPQLWDQFVPRIGEIQHGVEPQVSYGLMDHFNMATGAMDYMAGNPVTEADELPAGMSRWDVPANTYAVFETTIPNIGEAFDYAMGVWLPTSGYTQVVAPYFERYGEDFSPNNPVVSVYIPVKKIES